MLPDNYSEKKEPYTGALVKEIAPSCTINVDKGDKVVVEASMVQELKVDGELYTVVLENYIYGVISNRWRRKLHWQNLQKSSKKN